MKNKVLIVEDEPLIAKDLSFILGDIGISQIEIAYNYKDALHLLHAQSFDLALLDINISDENDGIDLATYIRQHYQTPFIFITSYYNASTVSRAKITQPMAYLVKPFNQMDIRVNVEMALYKARQNSTQQYFYLREKTGTIQLDLSDIIMLEAQDNYTRIVCGQKEILASQTLKAMLQKLPSDEFVRTHKSFAVKLDRITMIKGGQVYLDTLKVPIGRSFKERLKNLISIL